MALAKSLLEHSNAIEADLARYYPRDSDQLPEFYSGEMSLRRLWVLVSGLPQDSNTSQALDGEAALWSLETHLLARIANLLLVNNYKDSKKKPPKGQFVKAPGVEGPKTQKKQEKELSRSEFDALFTGG